MFKDIDIFIAAAQAIWNGQDPYRLAGVEVFYPLPFYLLFLPLAWLPPPLVHVLWLGLNGGVFVAILRRRALVAIFSSQAILTFILGQVDIVMMALFALIRMGPGAGIALGFMFFKPQLVLLLAPYLFWDWWRRARRELMWFALVAGGLIFASFLAQPNWPLSLLSRSGERMRAGISSSLWGLISFLPGPAWLAAMLLLGVILVLWAWRMRSVDAVETVGLLLSPFVFAYNLMPLYVMFRRSSLLLGMTVLSWIGFAVGAIQLNDRGSALVTVLALAVLYSQGRHPSRVPAPERSTA